MDSGGGRTADAATLDADRIQDAAAILDRATRSCTPIEPLTTTYPGFSLADAYAIQNAVLARRVAAGARLVGHKIGGTNRSVGSRIQGPDHGFVVDEMVVAEDVGVRTNELISPRAEAELGFVLGRSVAGPGATIADVLRSTAYVLPLIEITDSRIRNWQITAADSVADNGCAARVVLGGRATPVGDHDLRLTGLVLRKNGEVVSTAAGAAVMGHPAASVALLANSLASFGACLEPGQLVLSGAVARVGSVAAGDVVDAVFDHFGGVVGRFV